MSTFSTSSKYSPVKLRMLQAALMGLSVFAVSSVAMAETSVQLYGLVDAGYGYSQTKASFSNGSSYKSRHIGAASGKAQGSRWGMRGVEDLGNGSQAFFTLESGFSVVDGHGDDALFGRQAFVGLRGDSWGSLSIGRQLSIADDMISAIDPFGTDYSMAGAATAFGAAATTTLDNAIKYMTPNVAGLQSGIMVAYDKNTKTISGPLGTERERNSNRWISSGVSYNRDALSLAFTVDYVLNRKHNAQRDRAYAWNLAGAYDFSAVKVHAMYGYLKGYSDTLADGELALKSIDYSVAPTAFLNENTKRHAWLLGLSAPITENDQLMFSYQGSQVKNSAIANKIKTHAFGLAYSHALSARTDVYALGAYGQSKYAGNKLKQTEVFTGLRHRF